MTQCLDNECQRIKILPSSVTMQELLLLKMSVRPEESHPSSLPSGAGDQTQDLEHAKYTFYH